jgi:hypothetical protein
MSSRQWSPRLFRRRPLAPFRQALDRRRRWSQSADGPVVASSPKGYGYPAPPDIAAVSTFTKWHADTETMLATLAAKADMQDRRIAAL